MTVLDQFDLFVRHVDDLMARRLAQGGLGLRFRFSVNQNEGVSIEGSDPDEDDFRAYLTTLRALVISKDEPVVVNKIVNLAIRHVDDVELREALIAGRKVWLDEQKGGTRLATAPSRDAEPEQSYNARDVLDLYINGRVFHVDQEKERTLAALEAGPVGRPMIRYMLLDYATSATNYLVVGEERSRRGEGPRGVERHAGSRADPGHARSSGLT